MSDIYRFTVRFHLADDPFRMGRGMECQGPYHATVGPFALVVSIADGEVTTPTERALRQAFELGNADDARDYNGEAYPHGAVRSVSVGDRIELSDADDRAPSGSEVYHMDSVGFHRC